MTELDILREHRPDVAPPDGAARRRSRAVLAQAVRDAQTVRRPKGRIAVATSLAAAVVFVVVVGAPGAPPISDGQQAPWLLRPQPAGALTKVDTTADGRVVVRFLHPDADPDRIKAELARHGLALDVAFVPTDPFSVGTVVAESSPAGAAPIETLRQGDDLTGGGFGQVVGIRVRKGWTGEGYALTLGRPALDGETFDSTVALNAERPGGPLHCAGVYGMRPSDAAELVQALGYRVGWRTNEQRVTGTHTTNGPPPADYWIVDAHWHSASEILLFADARQPPPRDPVVQELVTRGCEGDQR